MTSLSEQLVKFKFLNLTSCGKEFDFLKSCRAPSQLFTALLLQPSLRQCSLSSLSVSVNIYDLFTFTCPCSQDT